MEKINILNEHGQYTDAAELDIAIKEQVKINEKRKQRNDGDVSKDKGEVGPVATPEM